MSASSNVIVDLAQQAPSLGGDQAKPARTYLALLVPLAVAVSAVMWKFEGRAPNPELTAFGTLLATLLFASAILERALDVLLSILMGGEADRLDAEIRTLKSRIESGAQPGNADESKSLAGLVAARARHQGATRRLAMPFAMAAGTIISAVGLRSLQPLFDKSGPAPVDSWQNSAFAAVDIFVTGTLLAGGSDGIHWIVALYRDFTDKNRSTKS